MTQISQSAVLSPRNERCLRYGLRRPPERYVLDVRPVTSTRQDDAGNAEAVDAVFCSRGAAADSAWLLLLSKMITTHTLHSIYSGEYVVNRN